MVHRVINPTIPGRPYTAVVTTEYGFIGIYIPVAKDNKFTIINIINEIVELNNIFLKGFLIFLAKKNIITIDKVSNIYKNNSKFFINSTPKTSIF